MKDIFGLSISLFFLVILPHLYHMKFTPMNRLIDVGKDIYCQHDENNNTIFPVKKSGARYTKVYKIIIPIFTASKLWRRNGTLVDNPLSTPIGATNKDNYIPVKEGEQYFFKIFGVQQGFAAPVLFLDEKDNYVKDFFAGLYTKSKQGVELTVPSGATKMHITNYNDQYLSVQKIINMTDDEIDKLCINEKNIMEKINNSYMEYIKNPIVYKKINKAYITFIMDDTRKEDEDYINLFIEKGIPLSLATVPERLIDNALSGTKTRLDMLKKIIATGKAEILGISSGVLTEEKLGNFSEMYNAFIKVKQMFNLYGIEVNGIISSNGNGRIIANEIEEKWVSSFWGYSDLFGLPPKFPDLCIDSVYYHPRISLFGYHNDFETMKAAIDKVIEEKKYHIIYFHSGINGTLPNLSNLLDYVKQKEKEGKLNIGNYQEFYEKNAIRINDIINNKHTYYVASNGKSEDGLSESNPMNYETLKTKKLISGDKVLFKRGDTFYGQLNLRQTIVDNNFLTLSSYGDPKKGKPIISNYKIVNKKECWEKESDNIYKIDLTNINNFIGIDDTTPESTSIGFMETKNKTKYYNLKQNLIELTELYDFCSDGTYFYVRTNGATPYEELGELKLAPRLKLLILRSNFKVENLHIQGTGAHGLAGAGDKNENIEIVNNIIEDIGGSFLNSKERYGNGIEFYGIDVINLKIHKNIIRNVYDVGFTIQGEKGCGRNITLTKNIFCLNSQDSEIWEVNAATGVYNYNFEDNIAFLTGRGWGYLARPDKYCASHILFWGYGFENVVEKTNIYFHRNYVYNPKRIYFIAGHQETNILFQKENCIRSDYNHYYLSKDSFIYWDEYNFQTRNNFTQDYNKDKNSEFILLDKEDPIWVDKITNSLDYKELRKLFVDDVEDEDEEEKENEKKEGNENGKSNSYAVLISIIVIIIIVLSLIGGILIYRYIKRKKSLSSLEKEKDFPLVENN